MLLRASGETSDREARARRAAGRVDPAAVRGGAAAGASGVRHGDVLVALAEAVVGRDAAALSAARARAREALGPAGLVDAVAVAANFERMVRIADATGIPLDAPVLLLTGELRRALGLDAFGSAANTPRPGALTRLAGRVLRPLTGAAMRWYARGPGSGARR